MDQKINSSTLGTSLSPSNESPFSKKQGSLLDPDSVCQSSNNVVNHNANMGKVLYIGVCFLFLFTAFTGAQTLVSEIYDQLGYTGLGKLNLIALYSVFTVAAFFIPGLVKTWSYKNGVFIGSLGYIFSMFAGAMTTLCKTHPDYAWCVHSATIYSGNLICSAINGFCGPMLWLSSSRYIMGCTDETNKGKYFGIFNGFVFAAGVIGSLLAAVLIKSFGQFTFYLAACGLTLVAIILLFFAPNVAKYAEEVSNDTVLQKTVKMIKLASTKRMRPFIVYVFFVGLLLAIYDSFEYEVIINAVPNLSSDDQDSVSATIFMIEGIMTIVASFGGGKLADIVSRVTILNLFSGFSVLAVITSFISYYTQSLVLAYIMASCWGIAYSGGFTLMGIVVAKDFGGTLEAYGVLQFVPNSATAIGIAFCLLVTDIPLFLYIVSAILIFSIVCNFMYKQKEEEEEAAGEKVKSIEGLV